MKYVMEVTPRRQQEIREAIDYAFQNPLTEKAMIDSGWGRTKSKQEPNMLVFDAVGICITLEEREGAWYKHLCFLFLETFDGRFGHISLENAREFARKYFGFKFTGNHKGYILPAHWNEGQMVTHVYEEVPEKGEQR